jgi:sec-independent protein translocase protein TatC
VTAADEVRQEPLATMPLMGHLRELRTRLIYGVLALGAGMALSLAFSQPVIDGLQGMCQVCEFQAIDPLEKIVTWFRVALVLGLAVASPVILYQIVAFVLPALHRHERRTLFVMLPGAGLLFALGLAFGYAVVLPRTIGFLASFMDASVASNWRIGNYIAFVTNLLLIIGVTFQTPLVVFVLARVGILSPALMRRYRRHAIVILAVLAAVLTPTPDPFTMMLVLGPMIALYELGILLTRFA